MLRPSLAAALVGAALAAPLALAVARGAAASLWLERAASGGLAAVEAVGWVLVPQLVLAVAVLGLALERAAVRVAGLGAGAPPGWIDPAVESALLLGMLGTLSGMVSGFAGLSPEALEPGPLLHALGTALRSSFVGFGIALVGVWVKSRPEETAA